MSIFQKACRNSCAGDDQVVLMKDSNEMMMIILLHGSMHARFMHELTLLV
jgi:hypothetical protein